MCTIPPKQQREAKAAGKAGGSQVDIDALNTQTKNMAIQNAKDSKALELQLDPQNAALRTNATKGLADQLGDQDKQDAQYRQLLNEHLTKQLPTPLLNAAIAKAHSDLAMGGKIDPETQNLITRHALATAGGVSGGGLELGRDITARDLGTSSLALSQQRLQNASQLGGQELQAAQSNNGSWLSTIGALQGVGQNQFARYLSGAQLGQSIQQPIVGLDPASAANIAVGNSNNAQAARANAANVQGQQGQNYLNFAGQALGAYSAYRGSQPAAPAAPAYGSAAQMTNAGAPPAVATRYGT